MLSTSLLCVTALLSGVIADSSCTYDSSYSDSSFSAPSASQDIDSSDYDCTGSIHKMSHPYQELARHSYDYGVYSVPSGFDIHKSNKRDDIKKRTPLKDGITVYNDPGTDLTYVVFDEYGLRKGEDYVFAIWSEGWKSRVKNGYNDPMIFNVSFIDKNGKPVKEKNIDVAGSTDGIVFKFLKSYNISGMVVRITFLGRPSSVSIADDASKASDKSGTHKELTIYSDAFAPRPLANFFPEMVCSQSIPLRNFVGKRVAQVTLDLKVKDVRSKSNTFEPIFFESIRRLARKLTCLTAEDYEAASYSLVHAITLDCGREICDMFAAACKPITESACFSNASPFDIIRSSYSFSAAFLKLCAMCAPEDRSCVAQSIFRAADTCSNPFMGFVAVVHVLNAYFNVSVPAKAGYEVIRQIEATYSGVPGVVGSYCISRPEDAAWFCGLSAGDCASICAAVRTPQWYPTRAWVGSSSVVISDATVVITDEDATITITDEDDDKESEAKKKAKKEQEEKKGFKRFFTKKVVVITVVVVVVSVVGVFALM